MSGSVPKGLDGSAYQRLVEICREEKRNVILDTSGALLTMGIEAKPTMIKPNLDEIRMLTGMSCDSLEEMIEAAKQIHEGGVEIVAVSLGAEGSFVVCDQGIYQAKVPKVDAVNTVGMRRFHDCRLCSRIQQKYFRGRKLKTCKCSFRSRSASGRNRIFCERRYGSYF